MLGFRRFAWWFGRCLRADYLRQGWDFRRIRQRFYEEVPWGDSFLYSGNLRWQDSICWKIWLSNHVWQQAHLHNPFLYLWWMVYLSFCKEWKYKTSDKTYRCFRCQYNREWGIFELRIYRERFAFQGEANPVTLRFLRKMNLSSGKILIS